MYIVHCTRYINITTRLYTIPTIFIHTQPYQDSFRLFYIRLQIILHTVHIEFTHTHTPPPHKTYSEYICNHHIFSLTILTRVGHETNSTAYLQDTSPLTRLTPLRLQILHFSAHKSYSESPSNPRDLAALIQSSRLA